MLCHKINSNMILIFQWKSSSFLIWSYLLMKNTQKQRFCFTYHKVIDVPIDSKCIHSTVSILTSIVHRFQFFFLISFWHIYTFVECNGTCHHRIGNGLTVDVNSAHQLNNSNLTYTTNFSSKILWISKQTSNHINNPALIECCLWIDGEK